jgi:hypothetical protein
MVIYVNRVRIQRRTFRMNLELNETTIYLIDAIYGILTSDLFDSELFGVHSEIH